ncbi:hypothetical protein M514_17127 [Trichuris suis]|uniref:Uncharacterized protein n=1 Tax=Trichuris suis TaxID=68888 RepID=A0A085NMF9_9BILA|nr:hypothetical protein M514_17127 [Trichuris suis]
MQTFSSFASALTGTLSAVQKSEISTSNGQLALSEYLIRSFYASLLHYAKQRAVKRRIASFNCIRFALHVAGLLVSFRVVCINRATQFASCPFDDGSLTGLKLTEATDVVSVAKAIVQRLQRLVEIVKCSLAQNR